MNVFNNYIIEIFVKLIENWILCFKVKNNNAIL